MSHVNDPRVSRLGLDHYGVTEPSGTAQVVRFRRGDPWWVKATVTGGRSRPPRPHECDPHCLEAVLGWVLGGEQ